VTGDLFYQQVHFVLFYFGFGAVLWGFDRVGMLGDRASGRGRARRTITWTAFGVATVMALVELLTPDNYRVASHGDVAYVEELLFFLPIFVALTAGAVWLPSWLVAAERQTTRPWLAALAGLLLFGMLRESTVLPSTDQPIVDLLLAFGPFTLAALCLYMAASVRSGQPVSAQAEPVAP
jgi:hypothetical protein